MGDHFLPSQTSASPQLVSHEQAYRKRGRGDIVLSCNCHLQLGHFLFILDVIPQSVAGFFWLVGWFPPPHSFKDADDLGMGEGVPGQAHTF